MGKKEYNTKSVGTIWMGTSKKGNDYVSVPIVQETDDKGKENKYFKGNLYFEDAETGKVYKVNQFKTFINDGSKHENILADLCVELNDEDFCELVTGGEDEE